MGVYRRARDVDLVGSRPENRGHGFFELGKGMTKTVRKKTTWQKYVAFMRKRKPETPLKQLLKSYDKAEYAKFKEDPKSFVGEE